MKKNEIQFGIVYECKEAINASGKVTTEEGYRCVISYDPGGYGPTGSPLSSGFKYAALWNTFEEAEEFAKKWWGNPWYHIPNGNYEIVELEPLYVQSGWKLKE